MAAIQKVIVSAVQHTGGLVWRGGLLEPLKQWHGRTPNAQCMHRIVTGLQVLPQLQGWKQP